MPLPESKPIATVIVCEDDTPTRTLLCDQLAADRFHPLPAPTAADALRISEFRAPDLALIDVALPDASGLDVLRAIRGSDGIRSRHDPELPVILISGFGGTQDRIRGLRDGADEYLLKPVLYDEVLARVTALLRRRRGTPGTVRVGEISIDRDRRLVSVGGHRVRLSRKEFKLLTVLASEPERVFTKRELLARIWGHESLEFARTVDAHASRLRRKLDPERSSYVINEWSIGYKLIERPDRPQIDR